MILDLPSPMLFTPLRIGAVHAFFFPAQSMLFGISGLYPVSSGRAGWVSEAIGVRELFVAE